MIIYLEQVLDSGVVAAIQQKLTDVTFHDGKQSAGYAAVTVKQNSQAEHDPQAQAILKLILDKLQQHPEFYQVARPKQFGRCCLNRYGIGDSYGWHVDDSWMQGIRTDLSFTLGLSALADYDGGELSIEDTSGTRSWRIAAGDILIYPSHYLHQVETVTRGQRVAMVGWLQSLIKAPHHREILFELQQTITSEFQRHGKTPEFDRLTRVFHQLQREWLS